MDFKIKEYKSVMVLSCTTGFLDIHIFGLGEILDQYTLTKLCLQQEICWTHCLQVSKHHLQCSQGQDFIKSIANIANAFLP